MYGLLWAFKRVSGILAQKSERVTRYARVLVPPGRGGCGGQYVSGSWQEAARARGADCGLKNLSDVAVPRANAFRFAAKMPAHPNAPQAQEHDFSFASDLRKIDLLSVKAEVEACAKRHKYRPHFEGKACFDFLGFWWERSRCFR